MLFFSSFSNIFTFQNSLETHVVGLFGAVKYSHTGVTSIAAAVRSTRRNSVVVFVCLFTSSSSYFASDQFSSFYLSSSPDFP
ncbi:unnamed protein product [Caenorhabditis auriculariae]|uniref:Uncharacterized protein n=1 Tax=Caenorhabditis auriculariae TaxID=2777116 RepID=A0A8S1GWE4_9PELO|nr:unnamed protein product [Caenorhabditis auriculariae]